MTDELRAEIARCCMGEQSLLHRFSLWGCWVIWFDGKGKAILMFGFSVVQGDILLKLNA